MSFLKHSVVLAIGIAFAAVPAMAQPVPKDLFKGRIKAGKYEDRVEVDMSGVPGIPKDHAKQSETRQRCMSEEEVAQGAVKEQKGCEQSGFRMSGDTATFTVTCKQGKDTMASNVRLTPMGNGFKTEIKTTGTQHGQSFTSTMRSESKYLGPC